MISQFITYPDIIENTQNFSILLIDANQTEIENVGLFCKTADIGFDIYLYREEINDLQWLSKVEPKVHCILISNNSNVSVMAEDVLYFGQGEDIVDPLSYCQHIEEMHQWVELDLTQKVKYDAKYRGEEQYYGA